MPLITITIPVVYGTHLREVLESIFKSSFQDFEVIANDSSTTEEALNILSEFDVTVIRKITKSFEGRNLTISASTGERVFLFDETRIMPPQLLRKVAESKADMITIKERDIGKGLLIFFSNIDKQNTSSEVLLMDPERNKSIIPRVYKRNVILKALERINRNLSSETRKRIVGLDLELIYLESFNITKNIEIINSEEIIHYGDERVFDIFRKYYRYGYSQSMLRSTSYREFAGLSGRNRTTLPIKNRLMSLPIQVLRGIPFVAGYLKGSNNNVK